MVFLQAEKSKFKSNLNRLAQSRTSSSWKIKLERPCVNFQVTKLKKKEKRKASVKSTVTPDEWKE